MTQPRGLPALEALVSAYHRRENGRLVFRRDGVEKSIILLFRKVVFANSTEKKDRLELLLATRKLLRKEEVLSIAAKAKSGGTDFMSMVQREGVLKDVALFDIMTERARDIITDLVTWPDAVIEADPRGFAAEAVLPLNTDLLPILLTAMMERFGADDCRRLLGSEDQVPQSVSRPHAVREIRASNFGPLAEAILERIDGKRAVVDVLAGIEGEGLSPMKLLAVLKLLGMFELPNQAPAAPVLVRATVPSMPAADASVVTGTPGLSSEEKAALSNIFEGATNLLEDDQEGSGELEIVVEDEPESAPAASVEANAEADSEVVVSEVAQSDENTDEPFLAEASEPSAEPMSEPQVQSDFNALLDIDPEEAAKLFSAGLELFQRGRISSAIAVYQQAIDKDPSNAEYYSALGIAYLESATQTPADEHAAMRVFIDAVKLMPESPKNHYYLGQIYERRGEEDNALLYYEEAVRLDENYTPAKQAIARLTVPAEAPAAKPAEGIGFIRKLFGR